MAELKISNAAAKVINLSGGTVADAIDIKGGYFVSQFIETTTKGEEGKIPPHACVEGALCYCTVGTEEKPGNKFYQYKSGEWVEVLDIDLSNYKEPITVDGNPITIVDDKGSTSITGSSITTETDVFKIVDTSGNPVAQISDEGLVVTDIRTENIRHDKETQRLFITGADISCDGDIGTSGNITAEGHITTPTIYTTYLNNLETISFAPSSSTPGIIMTAYNSGDAEDYYNFIGFAPMQENDPAILSNSGYIALYDAGPNGDDGQLTMIDSPTARISLSDWSTACQQSWRKTETTNQINTKLFLVGAPTQSTSASTQSNSNVYIGTDNNLYSNGKKTAVEELTMPVTKRFLREHKSEHRDELVDSSCKHFSLIDLYVKDDSGELQDLSFVLTVFGTINVVWGYSDESIENTGGYPAGSATTRCRNGIRLVGYVNHLTKTFSGSLLEKPYSSNTESKIRTFINEPITDCSASIDHCTIDGSMIWWSLDSASTDIKAL